MESLKDKLFKFWREVLIAVAAILMSSFIIWMGATIWGGFKEMREFHAEMRAAINYTKTDSADHVFIHEFLQSQTSLNTHFDTTQKEFYNRLTTAEIEINTIKIWQLNHE